MAMALLLSTIVGSVGSSDGLEEEEETVEEAVEETLIAFEIVNRFVYHFTDVNIIKVVWVSDFVSQILTDEDLAAANR